MRRRNHNTLSGGSGSRVARIMPIAAVALALIAAWVLAITMLGGQEKASSEAPVPPATTTEAAETAAAPGDDSTTASAPEDGAPESGSDPGGSEEPEAVEVERETPAPAPVPKKPVGQVIPEEPPTYNPLGKEIGPNDLTETQRGRVELAASQFVVHAYGFTGKGEKASRDYEAGISRSVVAPVFYESPGAGALAKLARQIEAEGVQATASLDSFEVSQAAPEKVRGTARFTVESDAGTNSYAQELLLENSGAIWRVEQAGEIQGGGR
jgi:hypothetical protein